MVVVGPPTVPVHDGEGYEPIVDTYDCTCIVHGTRSVCSYTKYTNLYIYICEYCSIILEILCL